MADEHNTEPDNTEPDPAIDGDPESPAGDDDARASQGGLDPAAPPVVFKGMTPGQRLAAKKAQKSIKKHEFKEELKQREQERQAQEQGRGSSAPPPMPEEVQQVANHFSDFMHENQGRILAAIAAFIVISVAVMVAQRFLNTGDVAAASALESAIETANAPIDEKETDGKTDEGKPVFATRQERAKKAAEAFAAVSKKFGGDNAATWATLGEAGTAMELGTYDVARKLYDAAYAKGKDDPTVAARALEGLGLAYEALGKSDEALKRYEELKGLASHYHRDTAEYHIARLSLAKGDRDSAKKMLKALYDRLSDRKEGEPASDYLKVEVEIRLAELDSSLVDKGTTPSSDAGKFSPEQLQRLLEQLKQKGGLPAGAGAE